MKKGFWVLTIMSVIAFTFVSCGKTQSSDGSATNVNLPEGALSGEFSVSAVRKIRFSKGNLRYLPTTQVWQFADNQYDVVGNTNSEISDDYEGWIDLFGWATAGTVNGDTASTFRVYCYKPTSIESVPLSYGNGIYGPEGVKAEAWDPSYVTDITGDYYEYDWGHNAIKNGGNATGKWRTLTYKEWNYLLFSRPRAMQLLALGDVAGVKGLFIFPDNYDTGENFRNLGELDYELSDGFPLSGLYNKYSDYSVWNSISLDNWKAYENEGVVFLPAAGYRYSKDVGGVNTVGEYWTADHSEFDNGDTGKFNNAKSVYIAGDKVAMNKSEARSTGHSVRLVMDIAE